MLLPKRIPLRMVLAWLACTVPAMAAETEILHYTARLHGIGLIEADFCLRLDATAYEATLSARTMGLVDLLVHGRSESHVTGAIDAGAIRPRAYAEHSRLSGEEYEVAIDTPGDTPVLRRQTPPQEKYRLPIPAASLPHAVDGLSSVVVQSVAAGRHACAGDTLVYDGRQVRRLTMHDGVQDTLKAGRSVFAGQALACETDSTMLAGFLKSGSVASQSKSRHGRLWLAPVLPGGPAVPVHMVFDADAFGDIVVSLDGIRQAGSAGCDVVHGPQGK